MALNLVLLRRFEAVCRLRSFSRAASELGLSQAAMTKSIRMLEEELEAQLLDRTTRTVEPTEMGQRLLARADELLAHADDVRSSIARGINQLRIASGATVLDSFVKDGLLEFRIKHPDVHVDLRLLSVADSADQLARRQADILIFNSIVASELVDTRWMRKEVIFLEPVVIICREGHPILEGELSFEALIKFDWVAVGFSRHLQQSLPKPLREALERVRFPKYLVPTQNVCVDMVLKSDVLTYGPESTLRGFPADAPIRTMAFPMPLMYECTAFTRADAPPPPLAAAFIDAVRSAHKIALDLRPPPDSTGKAQKRSRKG